MTRYLLDVRTATPHFPGIGRYVANLARELPGLLRADEQLILLRERGKGGKEEQKNGSVEVDATPFSLSQQWQVPKVLKNVSQDTLQQNSGQTRSATSALRPPHSAFRIPPSALTYHSPYYLMPYRPGVPTVLTFYDIIPIAYPEYVALRARLLFRLLTRLACHAADHIVSISDAASHDLMHHFGVPASKITTTPLAPDPRFQPQPPAEIERIRQKYNLPEHFFLYFGINKPHKNLVSLVESFDKVTRWQGDKVKSADELTLSPCHLVIAGAWDERYPEAKQRAAALGDAVRFLGRIEDADLPGLYAAATAFIFPSKYEGFGLPVLEAMACGTPVACSNNSSLPEVAGDAALLFNPQNISEISQTMEQLSTNVALRQQLSQRGLAQAQRFTWRRTAEATLDVYRNLAK